VKAIISDAAGRFAAEVKAGDFPTDDHSFH
jgi:ketopantoate hydroxymethyltransferase